MQNVVSTSMNLNGAPFLYGTTSEIRQKATRTTPTSAIKILGFLEILNAPMAEYDPMNRILSTTTAMEYRAKDNITWISCSANMSVNDLINSNNDVTLEVRRKSVGTTTPVYSVLEVTLPQHLLYYGNVATKAYVTLYY